MEEILNPGVEIEQDAAVVDAVETGAEDGAADQPQEESRAEVAFARRLAAERQKIESQARTQYEGDPAYQLGRMVLESYNGLSPQEAAEKAREDFINARVETLSKDPAAMAREIATRSYAPPVQSNDVQGRAEALLNESTMLQELGVLPQGYDLVGRMKADPVFAADCGRYGIAAAMAKAEQTRPRAATPIRPQGAINAGTPDFANMSSEDFAKYEEQINRAEMRGEKFKIK